MPAEADELDIVFLWKQNDTGIYGRRQDMFVKYLARHPRVHRIFHFDAPVDVRQWFRYPRSLGVRGTEAMPVIRQTIARKLRLADTDNVRFDTFLKLDSRRAGFRALCRHLGTGGSFADYLERALARQDRSGRRTVLWVCPTVPEFPAICERLQPDLVVADVIDDQRLWPLTDAERDAVDRNYADVLDRADVVLANCESVRDAMQSYADEVHVVANAAENVEGAEAWERPRPLRRLGGPIIGYVGNLEAVRLDVDLVASIAAERPDWQFVFIGSAQRGEPLRAIGDRPNVHLLGVRRYHEARRFIRHFDVAIIPHLDNDLTRHMNPLKLYVYFSIGVPIVATPIANTGAVGEFVRIGRTADEFVDRIEACLANGPPTHASKITAVLAQNSWEARVAQVFALVDEALPKSVSR
ncbi:MAG: glycosyltransferase [Pseudomonadales bacterium]|nr:glycosyltransferase [Pseudomonadales bacterium]